MLNYCITHVVYIYAEYFTDDGKQYKPSESTEYSDAPTVAYLSSDGEKDSDKKGDG